MKKPLVLGLVLLFGIVLGISGLALAFPVDLSATHGDPVPPEYWGVPDTPVVIERARGEISATGLWDNSFTKLEWVITESEEDDTFTYKYTWET